ncbi:MAG: MaoC family dehydratase [Patescibacteria group bacterium]
MSNKSAKISYHEIMVGNRASFSLVITEKLVNNFSEISGDTNPLHVDEEYASRTHFGHRIAHGMLAGALFSKLIGMHLPGKYSLYLSQTLYFHNPIWLGAAVSVCGEVTHKTDATKTVIIHTSAEDTKSKKLLVDGDALVKLFK